MTFWYVTSLMLETVFIAASGIFLFLLLLAALACLGVMLLYMFDGGNG